MLTLVGLLDGAFNATVKLSLAIEFVSVTATAAGISTVLRSRRLSNVHTSATPWMFRTIFMIYTLCYSLQIQLTHPSDFIYKGKVKKWDSRADNCSRIRDMFRSFG